MDCREGRNEGGTLESMNILKYNAIYKSYFRDKNQLEINPLRAQRRVEEGRKKGRKDRLTYPSCLITLSTIFIIQPLQPTL